MKRLGEKSWCTYFKVHFFSNVSIKNKQYTFLTYHLKKKNSKRVFRNFSQKLLSGAPRHHTILVPLIYSACALSLSLSLSDPTPFLSKKDGTKITLNTEYFFSRYTAHGTRRSIILGETSFNSETYLPTNRPPSIRELNPK